MPAAVPGWRQGTAASPGRGHLSLLRPEQQILRGGPEWFTGGDAQPSQRLLTPRGGWLKRIGGGGWFNRNSGAQRQLHEQPRPRARLLVCSHPIQIKSSDVLGR